jgi:sarcosine oxidase
MKRDYDYLIIGLGGIGAGAAYWLSRRAGGNVLGLEQFKIGHGRGASQDHSRIIRLSYHTPGYVRLAQQAYQTWAAVEAEAGEPLILKTGGLDFAPRRAAIPLSDYTNSLRAVGVPFEELDAAEMMRRWPPLRLTDDIHGLYQSESGLAMAARANAAHLRLARDHGAILRDHSPVTGLRAVGDEIEVIAGDSTYRCGKLILTVDAWANQLLAHFGLRLPLTITQEQVTYYATPHAADFMPDRFPIWIWMDDPCFYGFPVFGEAGPKIAQDVGGEEVTPETRTFAPNPAAFARTENFLRQYIPTMLGPVIYTKTCLYTLPPDRDFVIDALPDHPNVFLALGAAHAFKFTSLIGKILSELAVDGASHSDLSPFKFDRPLLQRENPPKNFMV